MNETNIDQIAKLISQASRNDLKSINELVRGRWDALTVDEARKFYVGQKVSFSGKYGSTKLGKIAKINQKSIKVDVEEGGRTVHWKVSPGLLRVA